MKMKIKVDKLFTLRRLHPKLGEIITWEVLTLDEKMRLGIIRQVSDQYLIKRVGWREFKIKYWLGSRFLEPKIAVHTTQKGLLKELFPHYYKEQSL